MAALNVDDFPATAALFPIKLYRMVCDPQCRCMKWGGDGEHLILNTRLFEDELLQQTMARWKYQLKTTSTTSFIRQLHAYGFRKVVEGFGEPNNYRRYYHPYFHRQRPDLLVYMKRNLRSSGAPKKPPLRIFDDANQQQMLMSSLLNQSIPGLEHLGSSSNNGPIIPLNKLNTSLPASGFEKMNQTFPYAAADSPQLIKPGEAGQMSSCETLNKRRRKAPPKKHPSFEDSCDFLENEEDLSPPSMVSRFPYKGGPLPPMYPMLMGAEPFSHPSTPVVKRETTNEESVMAIPSVCAKELKVGVMEITRAEDPKKGVAIKPGPVLIKQEKIEGGSFSEEVFQQKEKLELREPNVQKDPAQKEEKMEVVVSPIPPPKIESNQMEVDQPLDLSLPRGNKPLAVKPLFAAVSAKTVRPANLPPSKLPRMAPTTLIEISPKPKPPVPSEMKPPPVNVVNNNIAPSPITPKPQCGKVIPQGTGLPPFPVHNAPINAPPHSVLQPAYIAWPTRGVFCPQTKQWIHSRPTIIPLPFRSQQIAPGKRMPPGYQKGGVPLYQEPGKMMLAKEMIKMDPSVFNKQEDIKYPMVRS